MYQVYLDELVSTITQHWKRIVATGLGGLLLVTLLSLFLIPQEWTASTTLILGNSGSRPSVSSLLSAMGGSSLTAWRGLVSQGVPTDLYGVLLEARATRRHVVERCSLQQFFDIELLEQTVDKLGSVTALDTNPPTSITIYVGLKGSPRGLLPPGDQDRKIRQLTVAVLNAYVVVLAEQLDSLRISTAKSRRVFLEQEKPKAQERFYEAQKLLAEWEAAHHNVSPPKAAEESMRWLMEVQEALTEAQIAREAQAQREQEGRRVLAQQPEFVVTAHSEQANPELQRLARELAMLEEQIAQEQTFYRKTTQHPDLQQLLVRKEKLIEQLTEAQQKSLLPASLTRTRSRVYDEVLGQLVSAQVQKTALTARVKGLSVVLSEAQHKIESLAWASLEYARLYEEVQIQKTIYETLVKEYEAAVLDEKAEEPTFFVLDPAVMPWKRSSPHLTANAALGLVIGLLLGLAGVVVKHREPREKAVASAPHE